MSAIATDPKPKRNDSRIQIAIAALLRQSVVFIVLIGLMLYFTSQTDRFFNMRNLGNIAQQNSAVIVVTIGVTLTMLVGGIDLSVGSIAAFAGAVAAGLVVNNGLPFWSSMVLTLTLGFLLGAINGGLIVWGGLPPFIATLAMLGMARGFTLVYTEGRPISLSTDDETLTAATDAFKFMGRGDLVIPGIGEIPVVLLITLLVIVLAILMLNYTRFGLHIYAIGGSEETARLAGVPVNRVKIITYGISGMLAALAGMMLTARLFSAQPRVGEGLELQAIAAAVLGGVSLFGGVGSISGAVVGGLLVGVLGNGLNLMRVQSYSQQMIQGVVLVLAVMVDMLTQRLERRS